MRQLTIFHDAPKPTIVVWFSCGAASAVAAKLTVDRYKDVANIRIVNNPIRNEHSDNLRFLKDVERWLGHKIEFAASAKYPSTDIEEVFASVNYMSGTKGAPCTTHLKRKARQEWELRNEFDYIVMGFTTDERKRHHNFANIEPYPILPVLIDAGYSKNDCFAYLKKESIELPEIYKLGFPNANCIGCVKATSPTYWNLVREKFPKVFERRAVQSRIVGTKGCRLVRYQGKRIFLDELPISARGNNLKTSPECGIFCEQK